VRIYAFDDGGVRRTGVEHDGWLVDLGADLAALLREGPDALHDVASRAIAGALAGRARTRELASARLLAPLARPGKILCSGVNFRSHLVENPGATLPTQPFFFSKLPSAIVGPGVPIRYPAMTRQLDWEVELAVVIGRRLRHGSEEEARQAVAGFTILNDVSARDVQFTDHQITLGKNFDTFAPMGPCVVTPDELPTADDLTLRSFVNGTLMQDGSTRDWIFPLPVLLAFVSQVMTLEPGDVVSTGTPGGVGVFRTPPVFLRPGDVVVVEIEGIGRLENPVVAEPAR
jgi:2-keto-4-pentenoate hydratase/2-oxohepta-3-ene-1,7-dioic acid hydratase in catechol pathway